MKNAITKISIVALILSLPVITLGQYCNNFHRSYCVLSENEFFSYNGQSRSALFGKGQTSEMSIVVYKGQDYRISFCMDENLGSQIQYKLYETKKVKVEKIIESKSMEDVYDAEGNATGEQKEVINKETRVGYEKVKELLYDNSVDNYSTEIEFSVESTKRLTLEVTIPDGGGSGKSKGIKDKGKGKMMKSSDMGCIGVLVEHMPTPKSGF